MRFVWPVVLAAMVGCSTESNPRSCIDGVCSDPDYPFCDIDGTFGGVPKECIHAGCTAGVFERCVGADAYTCNTFGNSYDVDTCAHGCDDNLQGCRTCSMNSDCGSDTPVCDVAMNSCRACAVDSECDSKVCERGACVNPAIILYASPDGAGSASCSLNEPCAATTAVSKAIAVGAPRIVHFSSGAYEALQIPGNATQLSLVGQGATFSGPDGGLVVAAGAQVTGRALAITGDNDAVVCGQVSGQLASLDLRDSRIFQVQPYRLLRAMNCAMTLTATEIRAADTDSSSGTNTISVSTDGSLVGDRLHVHGLRTTMIGIMGQRMNVKITNSLLENVGFLNLATDMASPGTNVTFAWNTFASRNADTALDCFSATPNRRVTLENNVVFGTAVTNVLDGNGCDAKRNVLSPQSPVPADNIGAAPQFVDVATSNFRLKATSPGVNAGGTLSIPSDHDFTGAVRPQGGAADIGAYEQ